MQYTLKPSNNLKSPSARKWLSAIAPLEKFVNLILGLTHSELWEAGEKAHAKLSSRSETREIAGLWESVFSGIAVIANRQTIPHIDIGGSPEWSRDHCIVVWKIINSLCRSMGYRRPYLSGPLHAEKCF